MSSYCPPAREQDFSTRWDTRMRSAPLCCRRFTLSFAGLATLTFGLFACSSSGSGPDAASGDGSQLPDPVISTISAACTSQPGKDSAGASVTYTPQNMVDGSMDTAWRCDGDGSGQSIDIMLREPSTVTAVGLVPGYAKVDAADGSDRYAQNRKIAEVVWQFDSGQPLHQTFDDTPAGRRLQTIAFGALTAQRIRLTIVRSTMGGSGNRPALDKVAISEVMVQGRGPVTQPGNQPARPGAQPDSPADHCSRGEGDRAWWESYGGRIGADPSIYIETCHHCPAWINGGDCSAMTPSQPGSGTPILGQPWAPNQQGYGEVRPTTISNGGDPSGIVSGVRWTSWGGDRAEGDGAGFYVPPNGITAYGYEQPAHIVAFNLGDCDGKRMYRSITWYFPGKGEKFDAAIGSNICTG